MSPVVAGLRRHGPDALRETSPGTAQYVGSEVCWTMDAAADYAAARHALTRPLPAYVSYTVDSHVAFGPFKRDGVAHLVVRTSDGQILSGKAPPVQIGQDQIYQGDSVTHSPFDPHCYEATGATSAQFAGKTVEALALKDICPHKKGDEDFSVLYVDPASHDPIAAVGNSVDSSVAVHLSLAYARVEEHVLPAAIDVTIKGSGMMSWLDISAHEVYGSYVFSEHQP